MEFSPKRQNLKLIVCLSSQNEWMAEKKTGKCQFQNLLPTPPPFSIHSKLSSSDIPLALTSKNVLTPPDTAADPSLTLPSHLLVDHLNTDLSEIKSNASFHGFAAVADWHIIVPSACREKNKIDIEDVSISLFRQVKRRLLIGRAS
jgi:hypothetical protein